MNNVYFGHPVDIYDTEKEAELEQAIDNEFDGYVVNPSRNHYQQCYDEFGIDYFLDHVLQNIDVGVFHPFDDGTYGAGQAAEIAELIDRYKPVYEIDDSGAIDELVIPLPVRETREKLHRP